MHEAGKFKLLNVTEVDGRWHYTFSGAGEVFSVVRPEMSKEIERAIETGRPYQTLLDPPPADPCVAHGKKAILNGP